MVCDESREPVDHARDTPYTIVSFEFALHICRALTLKKLSGRLGMRFQVVQDSFCILTGHSRPF